MAIITDEHLTDEALIPRILSGEKHLFERFIKKYNPRLFRIGMAILRNDTETEEAMQSAYIKAYENMGRFEGKSSFGTWLTRILINEALMSLKKRKTLDPLDDINRDEQIEMHDPMNELLNDELQHELKQAVEKLPAPYRVVFIMREIEGMSTAETTQCLAISESNVKVRLNRAKEMLRNNLSHYVNAQSLYSFHLDRCERIRENVMRVIEATPILN